MTPEQREERSVTTPDPVREAIERAAEHLTSIGLVENLSLRLVHETLTAELLPAIAALDEAKDQRIAELEEMLALCQWADREYPDGDRICPVCEAFKVIGKHLPHCKLSAALSPANQTQGASDE